MKIQRVKDAYDLPPMIDLKELTLSGPRALPEGLELTRSDVVEDGDEDENPETSDPSHEPEISASDEIEVEKIRQEQEKNVDVFESGIDVDSILAMSLSENLGSQKHPEKLDYIDDSLKDNLLYDTEEEDVEASDSEQL